MGSHSWIIVLLYLPCIFLEGHQKTGMNISTVYILTIRCDYGDVTQRPGTFQIYIVTADFQVNFKLELFLRFNACICTGGEKLAACS